MKKDKISFHDAFYMFIFGCLMGWVVEGIWTFYRKGLFINHSALVIGPFNIVYGISAIVLTYILYKFKNSKNSEIFVISFLSGSVLEYLLSFCMEKLFGFVAWSYRTKPFNLNGRICLRYSIFWGILGIVWIKVVYPKVKSLIDHVDKEKSTKFMKYLLVFLVFDAFLTVGAIKRGQDYEKQIPPSNHLEEFYDEYFGVDYLNNMFNGRWNRK